MKGVYEPDLLQYFYYILGVQLIDYLLFALFCFSVHSLANNKYLGLAILIAVTLFSLFPEMVGISHKLLIFSSGPGLSATPFIEPESYFLSWGIFKLYWFGWIFLIVILAIVLWPRGVTSSFVNRLRTSSPIRNTTAVSIIVALVLIFSTGGFIFYQTNITNSFASSKEGINKRISYEKEYSRFYSVAQPSVQASKIALDIYPESHGAKAEILYSLQNLTNKIIDTVHFTLPSNPNLKEWVVDGKGKTVQVDENLGYLIYKLHSPLMPNEKIKINFSAIYSSSTFSNEGLNTSITNSHVWLKSYNWLPSVGYQTNREVEGKILRKKHGLIDRTSLYSLSNQKSINTLDSKIDFEAVISVPSFLTAIAPGALVKAWEKKKENFSTSRLMSL